MEEIPLSWTGSHSPNRATVWREGSDTGSEGEISLWRGELCLSSCLWLAALLCVWEKIRLNAYHHTCYGSLMWHLNGRQTWVDCWAAHMLHKHYLPASLMEQDGTDQELGQLFSLLRWAWCSTQGGHLEAGYMSGWVWPLKTSKYFGVLLLWTGGLHRRGLTLTLNLCVMAPSWTLVWAACYPSVSWISFLWVHDKAIIWQQQGPGLLIHLLALGGRW